MSTLSAKDGSQIFDKDWGPKEILEEEIRRARLSGPSIVTADATVAEMDA